METGPAQVGQARTQKETRRERKASPMKLNPKNLLFGNDGGRKVPCCWR